MGNKESFLQKHNYTVVSEQEKMMLVKNEGGDLFTVKKMKVNQGDVSNVLLQLNHPHIVQHKEILQDGDCLYLVLEHCEGGDLTQTINNATIKLSETEILDWTVKICMALEYLHDQQILHKNMQPKSIFFTACGTIRLGEFGVISEWSTPDIETADTKDLLYVAPEVLSGKDYDEKSDIWSLGCVVYEMCMLKCAFAGRNTIETISKILTSSYEALPEVFSEDLRQLVKDILQVDPENRPTVNEILTRLFIIKHLYEKSTQTTGILYKALDMLEELADGLEKVHFNTTVGSLAGGVVGLAGGITSIVGVILAPFTLGASLIVTGVGIGVGVAGGVAAGASNVTKMVNQHSNRQNIKNIIREIQEKITSTSFCIQKVETAVEIKQNEFYQGNNSLSTAHSGVKGGEDDEENDWANAGARLGRGLGGIGELVRLTQVVNVGKVAAQTARVVRIAEAATGVLSGLFAAVDIFFIALDSKEIHKLRKDYASIEAEQESEIAAANTESTTTFSTDDKPEQSNAKKELELSSEIMKFVKKIRETKMDIKNIVDELQDELEFLKPVIPNTDNWEFSKSGI